MKHLKKFTFTLIMLTFLTLIMNCTGNSNKEIKSKIVTSIKMKWVATETGNTHNWHYYVDEDYVLLGEYYYKQDPPKTIEYIPIKTQLFIDYESNFFDKEQQYLIGDDTIAIKIHPDMSAEAIEISSKKLISECSKIEVTKQKSNDLIVDLDRISIKIIFASDSGPRHQDVIYNIKTSEIESFFDGTSWIHGSKKIKSSGYILEKGNFSANTIISFEDFQYSFMYKQNHSGIVYFQHTTNPNIMDLGSFEVSPILQ